jgi:hypothetical protein
MPVATCKARGDPRCELYYDHRIITGGTAERDLGGLGSNRSLNFRSFSPNRRARYLTTPHHQHRLITCQVTPNKTSRFNLHMTIEGMELDDYVKGFEHVRCNMLVRVESPSGPNAALYLRLHLDGTQLCHLKGADCSLSTI